MLYSNALDLLFIKSATKTNMKFRENKLFVGEYVRYKPYVERRNGKDRLDVKLETTF